MTTQNAVLIRGIAASPGVAYGPWVRFQREAPASQGMVAEPEAEIARLIAAADVVGRASEGLADDVRRAGHAEILLKALTDDPSQLMTDILTFIRRLTQAADGAEPAAVFETP